MPMVDRKDRILIVGAGFSGCTVARRLADEGWKVLIIDRRDHIAGNAYDFENRLGIRIHKYGPHLFHTSNARVVAWVERFGTWLPYRHQVRAMLADGREVVMPPNRRTAEIVGADRLVDVLYRPYTRKMWGRELEEIDPGIINRVKPRDDDNIYYFPDDTFQAMPEAGYTAIIKAMVDHENIEVSLSTPFSKSMEKDAFHVFNSMPIDEYFDFSLGELDYRSIRFHHLDVPHPSVQSVVTVNFTHDGPYTRCTEWKKLPAHGKNADWTSITIEEPCDYRDNNMERYYPVKDVEGLNRDRFRAYLDLAPAHMTFIGRCGLYVYLDMHQAISSALATADRFLEGHHPDAG